ncbi:MAG: response regulator [Chitinivibrionales bacterium]|nr:response regulator [Chitinivibrionales bacterium]
MEQKRILVVDDDSLFRDSIVEILRRKNLAVDDAPDGPRALELFNATSYDLVISDMKMPGMSGIELLEQIRLLDKEIPCLIITAYGDVHTAVDAMKKKANDYIQKSDNLLIELEMNVDRLLEYRDLVAENRQLKSALQEHYSYVGSTASIKEIRLLVEKIAESRSTVLISGESGTGKELVARSIHYLSPRKGASFVKVNCAAMPEGLIESELFGHEKGAFTGAIKRKSGHFELASGGTLLLDEIGEMPMNVQAKLLRVLQEREINKVGGDSPVPIDVRIIATTNRRLEQEVAQGRFREDLYYRLDVFHIKMPSLRERKEDINLLADHFITKYNKENGYSVEGLGDGALDVLLAQGWPGNIRQLENTIERAVVLTQTGLIDGAVLQARSVLHPGRGEFEFKAGLTIAQAERELIIKTLDHCDNNRTKAAQILDISIRTLRNKLHEYAASGGGE